jgi:hypothetical protein
VLAVDLNSGNLLWKVPFSDASHSQYPIAAGVNNQPVIIGALQHAGAFGLGFPVPAPTPSPTLIHR